KPTLCVGFRPVGGRYTAWMEGFLPIFFLLVVLKIPVFGALWLVWWASRSPEPETAEEDSGEGFNRWRPQPTRPRGPHSGPSGAGAVRRRQGVPAAQRRPVFRPSPLPQTANASSGEKPSKRQAPPAASYPTR
ncbi:MAG: hypothetical protein ACM3N0_03260, partial [Chloroflexota bacterium]